MGKKANGTPIMEIAEYFVDACAEEPLEKLQACIDAARTGKAVRRLERLRRAVEDVLEDMGEDDGYQTPSMEPPVGLRSIFRASYYE